MNELTADYLKDLLDLEEEDEEVVNEERENDDQIEEEGDDDEMKDLEQAAPVNEELTEKDRIQQAKGGSNLLEDPKFTKYLNKIDKYWNGEENGGHVVAPTKDGLDEEEYHLISTCTEYVSVIDKEILNIHKYIRDIYLPKFPELENLILNPLEYVRVVMLIKNETDMNRVDLTSVLTQHTIMAVTLAGSSTTGKTLQEKDLNRALEACELILKLDGIKRKILSYVESRMQFLAPNLSQVVGSTVASQLITAAGGLEALAGMPACNIQVLGGQRKNLLGFSKAGQKTHLGLFGNMDMVKNAPGDFQVKLVRMLSTNCAKAVRVDLQRTDPTGSIGKDIKDKMFSRFDKIQEPGQARLRKPLPAPDDKPKKRRGGKKYRNLKEKTAMTEFRKQANRLAFGEKGEAEYRESGVGFGMMGASGQGKVRVQVKDKKINLTKKQKTDLSKNMGGGKEVSGLTSSIVLSSASGIQLFDPSYLQKMNAKKGTDTYFNQSSGFSTVVRAKQGSNLLMGPPAPK
jgi:U4/U6 small nuclear ribonucleoprotein PRP31